MTPRKDDDLPIFVVWMDFVKWLLPVTEKLPKRVRFSPMPYRDFHVYEPKRRKICAADFRDRVVHHAICNVLEPILDRGLIFDTYACRRRKGSHAAVRRTQEFARRFAYFLKCDIRGYFENVDHHVLKTLLSS